MRTALPGEHHDMTSSAQRVVVTGTGWITPLGHDIETVWARMMKGETGVSAIERFDATTFPTTFAAQVRDFDYTTAVGDPERHDGAGLQSQFALGAARQAWTQAGLDEADVDRRRFGIYLGAGEGAPDFYQSVQADYAGWNDKARSVDARRWAEAAFKYLEPMRECEQEPHMPATHLADEYGLRGPVYNCLTACAASTQAIGEAYAMIRRGDADAMLSGGSHTMLHVLGVTGFNRLTALSTRQDDITRASRPFSRSRDGFVMGEGAGVVILESLEHAMKRDATPLAEVIGYGSSADAFRITDIQPDGRGAAAAMNQALREAAIDPHARGDDGRPGVHYISAHGTGTKENDSIETRAVKAVFGDLAPSIPMSSIKSMMGHLIAAAGAVEFITCTLAIAHQKLPPTINLHDPDHDLDLDYVPNDARDAAVDVCLSNSFGFGGQNDTLIVRRFTA